MSKIVQTGTGATATFAVTDHTLLEGAMEIVKAPFALLSGPVEGTTEYLDTKTVAVGMVAAAAGGIFLGDKYGASIPVLGGRRGF